MTNAEKQEIIEAVLAALATNSKTIAQLSPKQSLIDSDLFEVAGGSRVTYQTLRSLIRDGLALSSQLSDYVTGEQAMMYLAKLDTETGTVDYKESPLVMLDGFKGVNGYTPVTGDLYYENYHGFQIWIKTAGGDNKEGIVANPNVAYVNKNDGAFYRWTGTTMVRIGGSAVINDLTTGGEGDALSAEMGKWLYTNLYTIFSQLGTYAFPNGKPQIDWGGGNPPVIPPCTVSKTIGTGLSSTGGDSDVAFGNPLEVSIEITDNLYVIDDDSVEVTMGGSPVAGAWNASTMKVTIAAVTGNVVINVPSLTYVQSGLVLHLDGKNRGDVAGHWKSLVNYNGSPIDFTLTSCDETHDDYVGFDKDSGSKGIAGIAMLDVGVNSGTIEAVIKDVATNSIYYYIMANGQGSGNKIVLGGSELSSNNPYIVCNSSPLSTGAKAGYVSAADQYAGGQYSCIKDSIKRNGAQTNLTADACTLLSNEGTNLALMHIDTTTVHESFSGKLYAIRVYSTQLSDADRAKNYAIDKKRFNLA